MEANKVLYKHKVLAPKLRFKELDGNWKSIIVGDHIISSAFGPRFSSDLYSDSGKVLTLRTTDMDNEGNICYDKVPLAELNLDELREHLLLKGDLVISRSGTIGVTGIFQGHSTPVIPGAFLIRFRFKKDGLSPELVRLYFNSSKGRNQIESLSAGGVQKNLTGTSVLKMSLVVPDFSEQQKIVAFLSAVDEKIQQLTRKKELLEQYKKGLMQQLFSGKLRFKNENTKVFPKWEEKKLGVLTEVVVGGTPSTTIPDYWGGQIPWLSSGELKNGEIHKASKFITELGLKKSSTKVMPKSTVLLAMTGATLGRIGFLTFESSGNQSIAGFLPNKTFNSKYLFYNLQFNFKLILSFAGGAAQPGINKNTIENLQLTFPTIEEQKKIANYLYSIDTKIENVNKQITQTKTFKKGLLQQMFI